jgi:hypothetical protein
MAFLVTEDFEMPEREAKGTSLLAEIAACS